MEELREQEAVRAEAIARVAHFGQLDKQRRNYIHHVARVANGVPEYARAAAWLHDVVEDTAITPQALVEAGILPNTVESVKQLTRSPGITYAEYVEGICRSGDRVAIIVKRADLVDHLTPECPPSLKPRYVDALQRIEEAHRRLDANVDV